MLSICCHGYIHTLNNNDTAVFKSSESYQLHFVTSAILSCPMASERNCDDPPPTKLPKLERECMQVFSIYYLLLFEWYVSRLIAEQPMYYVMYISYIPCS